MRKTIRVADAVARANYFLANSPDEQARARQATANFLESLLHSADAYHGFRFMDNVDGDESRRQYLVHRSMEDDLRVAKSKLVNYDNA